MKLHLTECLRTMVVLLVLSTTAAATSADSVRSPLDTLTALKGIGYARDNRYFDSLARIDFQRLDAPWYRASIAPVTPDSGITTGLVLAYGRPIAPPYRVEVKDGVVMVNSVPVDPMARTPERLRREEERRARVTPEMRRESDSIAAAAGRMKETYFRVLSAQGRDAARESAVAAAATSPYIDSLQIDDDANVAYWPHGENGVTILTDYRPSQPEPAWKSPPPPGFRNITSERVTAMSAGTLVDRLRCGEVAVCGPGVQGGTRMRYAVRAAAVMANTALTDEEKYVALRRLLKGNADWVFVNYDPGEWSFLLPKGE